MRLLRNTGQPPMAYESNIWLDWFSLVKRSIARFARGSISAQKQRILLPEEQEREHARTAAIARQWKERAKHYHSA